MNEIIRIGCPRCGSVLSVKKFPGIETKTVTCPVCKLKGLFTTYKQIVNNYDDEPTEYPEDLAKGNPLDSEKTEFKEEKSLILGELKVVATSQSFRLMPGRNVIGRKASQSAAQIQIPCSNKRMSREHLLIEVKKEVGKGFVHYISLNKEHVNDTFVNSAKLEYGDKIVLKHGDIIRLPDVEVRFEIPDEEGTEF